MKLRGEPERRFDVGLVLGFGGVVGPPSRLDNSAVLKHAIPLNPPVQEIAHSGA
jgi:hypothetical protein